MPETAYVLTPQVTTADMQWFYYFMATVGVMFGMGIAIIGVAKGYFGLGTQLKSVATNLGNHIGDKNIHVGKDVIISENKRLEERVKHVMDKLDTFMEQQSKDHEKLFEWIKNGRRGGIGDG